MRNMGSVPVFFSIILRYASAVMHRMLPQIVMHTVAILFLSLFISLNYIIAACAQEDGEAILLKYGYEAGDIYSYSLELEYQAFVTELTKEVDHDYELEMLYSIETADDTDDMFTGYFTVDEISLSHDKIRQNMNKELDIFCFPYKYCAEYDNRIGFFCNDGELHELKINNDGRLLSTVVDKSKNILTEEDKLALIELHNNPPEFVWRSAEDTERSHADEFSNQTMEFIEKQLRFHSDTIFVHLYDFIFPFFPENPVKPGDIWQKPHEFLAEGLWKSDQDNKKWINNFKELNEIKPKKSVEYTFVGYEDYYETSCVVIHITYKDDYSKLASNVVDEFSYDVFYDALVYFDYENGIPIAIDIEITTNSELSNKFESMRLRDILSNKYNHIMSDKYNQRLQSFYFGADMKVVASIELISDD